MDELVQRTRVGFPPLSLIAVLLVASVLLACGDSPSPVQPTTTASVSSAVSEPVVPAQPVAPGYEVLIGAGDIAGCGPELADAEATARLLDSNGGTIFTAGDNVQAAGTAQEFRNCYSPTWGRHKDRIRPSPGNHDWQTASGSAYFDYFGSAAGPAGRGYYSYDLGAWHVISLNGNVSMKQGSAQASWLRQDLEANRAPCTLAYWHQPLFSSSTNGNNAASRDAWQLLYDYGAEVVMNGHDHLFERFAPQDPSGRRDDARGIRQFTVGTGGKSLSSFGSTQPNSEVRSNEAFGVLRLTLGSGSYSWSFLPVAGETFTDSGTATCH